MVVTNVVKIVSISIPQGSPGYCFSDRGCATKTDRSKNCIYIFKTIYALNALNQLKLKTCNKGMI